MKKVGADKKPRNIVEALNDWAKKGFKVKIRSEEEIAIIKAAAADEISKVRNFSLGGRQPKPSQEEMLRIEIIEGKRDIDILMVKLKEKKRRLRDFENKKK